MIVALLLLAASAAPATATTRVSARIVSAARIGPAQPRADLPTSRETRDPATGARLRLVEFQ